jgi:hypothetical protein
LFKNDSLQFMGCNLKNCQYQPVESLVSLILKATSLRGICWQDSDQRFFEWKSLENLLYAKFFSPTGNVRLNRNYKNQWYWVLLMFSFLLLKNLFKCNWTPLASNYCIFPLKFLNFVRFQISDLCFLVTDHNNIT